MATGWHVSKGIHTFACPVEFRCSDDRHTIVLASSTSMEEMNNVLNNFVGMVPCNYMYNTKLISARTEVIGEPCSLHFQLSLCETC